MAFCENCGNKLSVDTGTCEECNKKPASSSGKDKGSVHLSENEVRVKTYHCSTLKAPKGEGYITVTNKRVIFHGHGESSRLVSEVPIETVSGISTYYGQGIRTMFVVYGIISAMLFLLSIDFAGILSLVFLIATILFFVFCKGSSYYLSIYSSGASGTPINVGRGALSSKITGQGAMFAEIANPTDETEAMMNELGAIVLDLKTLGDHAISKWKVDA